MKIANCRRALGLGLLSTTMIAGAAHAQTPDAPESTDIVVTATKRGETTVQDTALSITAFDQRALERLGTTELDQVLAQVPGVNFIDNGGPGRGTEVASIRGLSPVADNTLPIVAQYLDGAPRFIQTYRMFDIGEVSVLRGPQGTLWGAQSIGGLISIRSARPNLSQIEGYVQAGAYATEDSGRLSGRLSGAVSLPLVTDKLAVRVAAQTIDESGYVDAPLSGARDINTVRDTSWRASVRWQPADEVELTLIYHGDHLRTGAPSYFTLGLPKFQTNKAMAYRPGRQDFDLVNAIADVDLGGVTFNYTGAYFDFRNTYDDFNDNEFGTGAASLLRTRTDRKSWTHEFRLASEGDNRFDWIVGAYLDRLKANELSTSTEIINPITQAPPVFREGFQFSVLGGPETRKERAIFGEVYFDLTPQVELVAGARVFKWSVNNQQEFTYFGSNLQQTKGKVSGTDSFFKVGINYKPTDNLLIYALRSEGFRPGGFNPFAGPVLNIPEEFVKYEPDRAANYEIGFKHDLLDRQLFINADVYFLHWTDIQAVVFNATNNFAFTTNAPALNAWGSELELVSRDLIADGLFLSASYAYTKNEFLDSAQVFPGTRFLIEKGDELRRTVRHSWTLNGEYRFPAGNDSDVFLRANYWHKSPTNTRGFNGGDGDIRVPAQDIVNLSAGVEHGPVSLRAYVDNVFNGAPLLQVIPRPNDTTTPGDASTVRPRTFGIEGTFRF